MKGESSGNVQEVKQAFYDCDNDVLLFKVNQVGNAACHTGHRSCFYTELKDGKPVVTAKKVFDPGEVYGK
jgi:phosphoribosyl-AMP cyclohydrolase